MALAARCRPPVRARHATARPRAGRLLVRAQNLAEQLLDVIEGGPKLRKWYGRSSSVDDMPLSEREAQPAPEPEEEEGAGDAVLVSESDSSLAEAVVMQLIVAGRSVRLLTGDGAAAARRYGDYVRLLAGDARDSTAVRRALRGCAAVVVTGELGALAAEAARCTPPPHVLLLSRAARADGGPLAALTQSAGERVRGDARREQLLRAAAPSFTILRLGAERDAPGGRAPLLVSSAPGEVGGAISVEDAACVAVAALGLRPTGATLEVAQAAGGVVVGGALALAQERRADWLATLEEALLAPR